MKWKNITTGSNTFFITGTILKWQPLFSHNVPRQILIDDLIFYTEKYKISINAYVIMPDHYHLLLSFPELDQLHHWLRNLHGHSSREINDMLSIFTHATHEPGSMTIWKQQARVLEITSSKIQQRKLDYIHANPVRAGLVGSPGSWDFSSWKDYLTDSPGLIPVERIS